MINGGELGLTAQLTASIKMFGNVSDNSKTFAVT